MSVNTYSRVEVQLPARLIGARDRVGSRVVIFDSRLGTKHFRTGVNAPSRRIV